MNPKKRVDKKLGEILVQNDLISDEELKNALQVQTTDGGLLGEVLIRLGYLGEGDILRVLNVQYGFAYLPLENYKLDEKIVKEIPENMSRKHNAIAVDIMGDIMTVAMSNPLNSEAVDEISEFTGKNIQVFIEKASSINKYINLLFKQERLSRR